MDFSQLPALSSAKPNKKLFSNTTVIWNESHLLNRMLYKSKNELRQWKSYKKTLEFQRCLKRIAHMEMWFNTASFNLKSDHDLEMIIGYLDSLDQLIDATREVALSTFYYQQLLCQQGLFVQKTMVVAPIIARIHCFLGRLKTELPPLQQKYLKEISTEAKRNELTIRFVKSIEESEDGTASRQSNILVTSQLKEKRGPQQYQNQKKGKKQKSDPPSSTSRNDDDIDEIFGSF